MKTAMKITLLSLIISGLLGLTSPAQAQTEVPCDPPDPVEPNETAGSGPALIVGQPQGNLQLSPLNDLDFFRLWGKAGETYRLTTASGEGVDTRLRVYDPDGALLAENDDYNASQGGSRVIFLATTTGWYTAGVDSPAPMDWGCRRYNLQVEELAPTPTSTPIATLTPTPTPTLTATPTSTPTVTPTGLPPSATPIPQPLTPDAYEPNNTITQAAVTGMGLPIDLNFNPAPLQSQVPDRDWFRFAVKAGDRLQIETLNLAAGLDTLLTLYGQHGEVLGVNDDCQTARRSCLTWTAGYNGVAYVQITAVGLLPDPATATARSYNLVLVNLNLVTPTATPTEATATSAPTAAAGTATTEPTAIPAEKMPDPYEPNYEPGRATIVGQGQTVTANFNPWPPGATGVVDNDFYKFSVKTGDRLRIETRQLAPGLDTNLILYRENGPVIGGNDDCSAGERRSCLAWTADYSGVVYLLVGPVGLVPDPTAPGASAYSLAIINLDLMTPTPAVTGTDTLGTDASGTGDPGIPVSGTPGPGDYGQPVPWPVTPVAPVETVSPMSSGVAVQVRPFSLAPPTATPQPLQPVTLDVTIYYDANNNQAPDNEEGVIGLDVRVLDSVRNRVLGQAFTDRYGHATLTVATTREVRLSVPYLSYNQTVRPPGKELVIRLAALQLPSLIP